jgi:hypothetical protein
MVLNLGGTQKWITASMICTISIEVPPVTGHFNKETSAYFKGVARALKSICTIGDLEPARLRVRVHMHLFDIYAFI